MSTIKIGVIFALHGLTQKEFDDVMVPWVKFKEGMAQKGVEIIMTAVSYTFLENRELFPEMFEENRATIEEIEKSNYFSFIFSDKEAALETNLQEAGVRDKALQFLKSQNVDFIWLWDGDEFATTDELNSIYSYLSFPHEFAWFSISYKNYVFDNKTYLSDPFTPPRIFKANYFGRKIHRFYLDNDISYLTKDGEEIRFQSLPHRIIPRRIAWIKHLSWLSDERSKRKIKYQLSHFGKYGGDCSYAWDEKNNKLIFNLDFFKKRGEMVPQTEQDT
jgi:hypothetical protein